jgi:hypothetical protein
LSGEVAVVKAGGEPLVPPKRVKRRLFYAGITIMPDEPAIGLKNYP